MAATWPAKTDYTTGSVLTAAQMNAIGEELNDLHGSGGVATSLGFTAGKNAIINGDFGVWQRGTSFTATGYTADRFRTIIGNTCTISQQTFTPGTAPVSGYEGTYYLQLSRSSSSTSDYITQKIEDVRKYAGQTVTLSFWAKADAATTLTALYVEQNFGSGGSGAVSTNFTAPSFTTSWARYTMSISIPAITGKTIGSSSFLDLVWNFGSGMGNRTIGIWGVQLEAGSTATSFQTATGTIQGELAACQRYYWKQAFGSTGYPAYGFGQAGSSTQADILVVFPVTMRTAPTLETSGTASHYCVTDATYQIKPCSSVPSIALATPYNTRISPTATGAGLVAGYATALLANNTASSFLGYSAEL